MADTIALNTQLKQLTKLLTTAKSECEALEKEYEEIQTSFEQVYEGVQLDRCDAIQELKETLTELESVNERLEQSTTEFNKVILSIFVLLLPCCLIFLVIML